MMTKLRNWVSSIARSARCAELVAKETSFTVMGVDAAFHRA